MQQKHWFIHVEGESFGPVPTSVVNTMLKQNRLQIVDFGWTPGFTKWTRLIEIHEFAQFLPAYPDAEIPVDGVAASETSESSGREVTKTASPAATPKKSPKPSKPVVQAEPEAEAEEQIPVPTPKAIPLRKKLAIRRDQRVAIDAKVIVDGHGEFKALNISLSGIFFATSGDFTLAIGTDIKFKIECAEFPKVLTMTGVVMREEIGGKSGEGKGFGAEFTRVNPAYKRIIEEYLEKKLAAASQDAA